MVAVTLRMQVALLLGLVTCALAPRAVRAAPADEKKPAATVVKFLGSQEGRVGNKKVLMVAAEPVGGGQRFQLYVPNKDPNKNDYEPNPEVAKVVGALQAGDFVKIEVDSATRPPALKKASAYDAKPGEDGPNVYRFENAFENKEGRVPFTAVVLSRFDQTVTVAVPPAPKGKDGTPGAGDARLAALLDGLKGGDLVEAEIRGSGKAATLVDLDRYEAPKPAKFVKASEAEVDGQKRLAVELEAEGKPTTVLLGGKMQGKKWVPDAKAAAAVKKLKPDDEVMYRAREEGTSLVLRDLQPVPKEVKTADAAESKRGAPARKRRE
jgi:hypothetical protein